MFNHGMRLDKYAARTLLNNIVDLRHAHLDVVQIHRADVLSCSDGDVLLIKLSGKNENSLYTLFKSSINISGKIDRYRTGFLTNYGYFRRHALPASNGHCVTYV